MGSNPLTGGLAHLAYHYENPRLEQNVAGIRFPNPVGLAAGFDKNAWLVDLLPQVGFGFLEVGSVTGEDCAGNPKPRLWRLERSRSILVNFGLYNQGCEVIAQRLRDRKFTVPLGVSIAKTNCAFTVDTEEGIRDYLKAFRAFGDVGDYRTVNISCPNAYGGQPFTDVGRLDQLLAALKPHRDARPLFLKLSPDRSRSEVAELVEVALRHKVNGVICSNLTKDRDNPLIVDPVPSAEGGMSGKVVEERANELVRQVRAAAGDQLAIIGCGGVSSAEDAYTKMRLGASLVQLITGMIYEGPQLIGEITQGLVALLDKDGFDTIDEVVDSASP